MNQPIERESELPKESFRKNGNSTYPLDLIFRLILSPAWMTVLLFKGRLKKADRRITIFLFVLAMYLPLRVEVHERFSATVPEWLTSVIILYGILHVPWFIIREFQLLIKTKKAKKMPRKMELNTDTTTVLDKLDEYDFSQDSRLAKAEKRGTNEEAYREYERAYDKLVRKAFNQKSGIVQEDISGIRSFVTERMELAGALKKRIAQIEKSSEFEPNKEIREWIAKSKKYLAVATPQFFGDTLAYVESIQQRRNGIHRGIIGEREVIKYLQNFEDEFQPLYGIRFQSEKGTVENDALLFTERGIFSLEIKNIMSSGNQKLKVTRDGMAYEWRKNKWEPSPHQKIFDQVNRQIVLTEKKLAEQFPNNRATEIRPIIVIPNQNVEIINESLFDIIRPAQIPTYVRKAPIKAFKHEMTAIREFLKGNDIGAGTFPYMDMDVVSDMLYQRLVFMIHVPLLETNSRLIYETYRQTILSKPLKQANYLRKKNLVRGRIEI